MNEKKKQQKVNISHISTLVFVAFIFVMFIMNILKMNDRFTYSFININGWYQGIMQRDYIYDVDSENDIIKTSSGQLVSKAKAASKEDVMEAVSRLKKSSDWCSERGIPLIYVQAPSKLSFTAEGAMPGIKNNTYEKVEWFFSKAEQEEIEFIDAREWFEDDYSKDFFATDHHWTLGKSRDVASRIGEYLNSHYDFGIDDALLDEKNYNVSVHKDVFLGAEGRRVGKYYAGLDDIDDIIPLYDTDFSIRIEDKEGKKSERKGSFEETVMDRSKDIDHYSFEDSAYYLYWGGDYGRIHVDNNINKNGRNVMVFKDSYGAPVTAFMTPYFESMDIIDIRYYEGEKSVKEIIADEDPDAVLFIYGPGYLAKKKMFAIK